MAQQFIINLGEVERSFLNRLGRLRIDDDMAERLAEVIGGGMHDRAMQQASPDGDRWQENAESTVARKGHGIVGVDSGEMLYRDNFTRNKKYSGGNFTLAYAGPVDKLRWFEGDNNYGVARKVWGMDPIIRHDADQEIRRILRDRWRR